MLDVAAYLERIGYSGRQTPSAETLRNIHRAHLLAVPFENLDIGWAREIRMDQEAFVRKIVEHRRGGFCYELNGAFAALLQALGFTVTLLSARVPARTATTGRSSTILPWASTSESRGLPTRALAIALSIRSGFESVWNSSSRGNGSALWRRAILGG